MNFAARQESMATIQMLNKYFAQGSFDMAKILKY